MKRISTFTLVAGLLVLVVPPVRGWSADHENQRLTTSPATLAVLEQPGAQDQQQQQPEVKTFTGKSPRADKNLF